ncbi:MAG: hypothetical protein HXY37_07745 [Chloroflexi bacterium]|nr:hypothetical protein [Chloroflexota bacterium]
MSRWNQSIWHDVRWDHPAAAEAAAALRRTADEIDRSLAEAGQARHEASSDWRGVYREFFDVWRTRLHAELNELAAACRRAAQAVDQASARAREEQARRVREREEHERREREERARRARESREQRRI